MRDARKFRISMIAAIFLVAMVIANNILGEDFSSRIESYIERRIYYERVITKKGITLHKGMYWKEKE